METKESVIVALFDVESEAYQAFTELKNAAVAPSYTVSEAGLVAKKDGNVQLIDRFLAGPDTVDDTLRGGAVGSLVGILGGPMGVLLGGSVGLLAGSVADGEDASHNASIISVTANKLYDGETAIVMLAQESLDLPLDQVFAKYEGQIIRRDAATVEEELEELAKVQADTEAKARAALRQEKSDERKAKIEGRRAAIKAKFSHRK